LEFYTTRNRLNIPYFAARGSIVAVAALASATMMAFNGTPLALNRRTTGTISSMQILKSSGEGLLKMVSASAPAMISKSGFDFMFASRYCYRHRRGVAGSFKLL
jgi:hypothetical protein